MNQGELAHLLPDHPAEKVAKLLLNDFPLMRTDEVPQS